MKTLAWILTAAAVLVGADTFVMSSASTSSDATAAEPASTDKPIQLGGASGVPDPPPDAHE